MISYLSNPLPSLFFLLQPLPLGTQTLWGRKLRGERLSVLDGVFSVPWGGTSAKPSGMPSVARWLVLGVLSISLGLQPPSVQCWLINTFSIELKTVLWSHFFRLKGCKVLLQSPLKFLATIGSPKIL